MGQLTAEQYAGTHNEVGREASRHALATAAGETQIPDGEAAKCVVGRTLRSLHHYQHVRPDAIPGRDADAPLAPQKKAIGHRDLPSHWRSLRRRT
jgi:hypothetical protein